MTTEPRSTTEQTDRQEDGPDEDRRLNAKKPADFDFNYAAWYRHEKARRTQFGQATLAIQTAGLFLLLSVALVLLLPAYLAKLGRRLAPETHKTAGEA